MIVKEGLEILRARFFILVILNDINTRGREREREIISYGILIIEFRKYPCLFLHRDDISRIYFDKNIYFATNPYVIYFTNNIYFFYINLIKKIMCYY